jgi:dihydroorotate dehydrogenase (fumarate)
MNLTTRYLGMTLKHPIVASASLLSHTLDSIKLMEDSGAAAIVMYSLFEEQMGQGLRLAYKFVAHPDREDFAEIAHTFPNPDD